MPELPSEILDHNHTKQIASNDLGFIKELFELFIDNSQVSMRNFEAALQNDDSTDWYTYAHALKGSSSSIGAFRISKIYNEAQNLPGLASKEQKTALFNRLKEEYLKLVDYLKLQIVEIDKGNF